MRAGTGQKAQPYYARGIVPAWAGAARTMWEAGERLPVIAAACGVSPSSVSVYATWQRWDKEARAAGAERRKARALEHVRALYEAGALPAELVAAARRKDTIIYAWAKRFGWDAAARRRAMSLPSRADIDVHTCVRCGRTKPVSSFGVNGRSGTVRSTCRACKKAQQRRRRGMRVKADMQRAAEERRVAAREARGACPHRTLRRLLRRLLEARCAAEGVNMDAARYRARYRCDPEFRAKEILRRQVRDYTLDSDGTLTPAAVQRLFAEAKQCPYCERPMHPRKKTLDHIVPRSRGGKHSLSNVVVCCLSCNSSKNDRTLDEWRGAA